MSLSLSVVRGGLWNFTEQFLRRGVAAASTILLSYFLSPADFGLVAMLSLFLALAAGLMDSGLREALIRRRRLSPRLLNTALWASLVMGCVAYLALVLGASWVADFYAEPRLTALIQVAGLAVISNALQTAPAARLANALDFRSFIKASFPASLISCALALVLAYAGFGVWALIAQSLAASVITTCLLWRVAGWRPRWVLDKKPLISLYLFGYKLFFSGLISISVRNTAPILIAKFLGATLAGYYYFVDKIMEMVMGQLVYSVQNVTYPAFSKVSGNALQLKAGYRKVVAVTVFVVSPCLAIAAGMGDALFALVFADKWQAAVPYFRWMCVIYLLYPLHAINLNILKVKGRSDIFLKLEIVKAIISVGMVLLTVRHGLIALLIGQLIGSVLCYLPNSFYSKRLIDYSVREQLGDVLPGFLLAAVAGAASALVSSAVLVYSPLAAVVTSGLAGLAVFAGVSWSLRMRATLLLRDLASKRGLV